MYVFTFNLIYFIMYLIFIYLLFIMHYIFNNKFASLNKIKRISIETLGTPCAGNLLIALR